MAVGSLKSFVGHKHKVWVLVFLVRWHCQSCSFHFTEPVDEAVG